MSFGADPLEQRIKQMQEQERAQQMAHEMLKQTLTMPMVTHAYAMSLMALRPEGSTLVLSAACPDGSRHDFVVTQTFVDLLAKSLGLVPLAAATKLLETMTELLQSFEAGSIGDDELRAKVKTAVDEMAQVLSS